MSAFPVWGVDETRLHRHSKGNGGQWGLARGCMLLSSLDWPLHMCHGNRHKPEPRALPQLSRVGADWIYSTVIKDVVYQQLEDTME